MWVTSEAFAGVGGELLFIGAVAVLWAVGGLRCVDWELIRARRKARRRDR